MMSENKYVIKINEQDNFDLYVNGIKTVTASFIGGLLIAIGACEQIVVPTRNVSESYILAILHEAGVSVDVGKW